METKTSIQNPSIFLTDYASYNNGTQFEFGHWVDLTDFTDADELNEYIKNHFKEADEKSPLGWGSIREEIMITDFENFPASLYSESGMNFENVYEFIDLDDNDKIKVAFILDQGNDFDYAINHYDNVYLTENTRDNIYDLFEMYYPEALDSEIKCNYITIDYDRFVKENYTEFDFEGTNYLINDNWNN
jgi:hypothetical protein